MVISACTQTLQFASSEFAVFSVPRPKDYMKINSPKVGFVFCQCRGSSPGEWLWGFLWEIAAQVSPNNIFYLKPLLTFWPGSNCPSGFVRDTHSLQGTSSLAWREPLSKCWLVFIILGGEKKPLCVLRCGQNCQAIHSAVFFFVHHLKCPQFCKRSILALAPHGVEPS